MDDLDRPYDPDPLAVGDRVQVRLSGECRHCEDMSDSLGAVNGLDGVIEGTTFSTSECCGESHHYATRFTVEHQKGSRTFWRTLARTELERLPAS